MKKQRKDKTRELSYEKNTTLSLRHLLLECVHGNGNIISSEETSRKGQMFSAVAVCLGSFGDLVSFFHSCLVMMIVSASSSRMVLRRRSSS